MKNNNVIFMLFGMMLFVSVWGMEHPIEELGGKREIARTLKDKTEKKKKKKTIDLTSATINLEEALGKTFKVSKEQQIINLKEKIDNFSVNKEQAQKYAPILKPIEFKFKDPSKLNINTVKAMDYSVDMIKGEDIQTIITRITEQKKLGLEQKLDILRYLRELPGPVFQSKK